MSLTITRNGEETRHRINMKAGVGKTFQITHFLIKLRGTRHDGTAAEA